jgi:UDP-N-acetylmuramoyl-tripeptide--D-alanyl-D-alanine ligase
MKSKKIQYLEKILRLMAVVILNRHKPKIIAITGSVGKTSTKAAVFEVLSSKFYVRENQKNYNNEIGLPLTIIGADSGGGNIFAWVGVGFKWLGTLISSKYPEILILELGVDRPGDMDHFMSFLNPYVGIMTNISASHIEFFKTIDNIAKEKRKLIEAVPSSGFVILNVDDEKIAAMREKTHAHLITIGTNEKDSVSASNVAFNYNGQLIDGISFKLNYAGKNIPIRLRHMLAMHSVYQALIAAAVGIVFKMNLVEIGQALESLRSPQGRMNLFEGKNESYIIDDTYNASPTSTISALQTLKEINATRKIAVLGDMLELGGETEKGHRTVGKAAADAGCSIFIAVGDRMKYAADELLKIGFAESNIFKFDSPIDAGEKISQIIQKGDTVLVKGSQGIRMEKVTEEIVANYDEVCHLMCRQSSDWKKKPFIKP